MRSCVQYWPDIPDINLLGSSHSNNNFETGSLKETQVRWFPLCCRLWNNWASLECWERAGIVHRQPAACCLLACVSHPLYSPDILIHSSLRPTEQAAAARWCCIPRYFRRGHRSGIWARHGGRAAATEEIYQKYFGWINETAAAGKLPTMVVFVSFACTVYSLTCVLEDDFWIWLQMRRKKTVLHWWNIPGREQFWDAAKLSKTQGNKVTNIVVI